MNDRLGLLKAATALATAAILSSNCSGSLPAGPTAAGTNGAALSGSSTNSTLIGIKTVGAVTTSTPAIGTLKICVTGGSPGTFTLVATPVSGGTVNAPSPLTVQSGQCIVAAEDFDAVTGVGANIVTTETSAGFLSVSGQRIDQGVVSNFAATNGMQLFLNNFHGYTLTFVNSAPPPPPATQGCSPGYFKNNTGVPAGFDRSQTLDAVLTTNVFPSGLTVGDALSLKGGGINALARHAAAAVLNAAAFGNNYGYTLTQLRAIFDQIEGGTLTINGATDLLASKEDVNGIVCPLN